MEEIIVKVECCYETGNSVAIVDKKKLAEILGVDEVKFEE